MTRTYICDKCGATMHDSPDHHLSSGGYSRGEDIHLCDGCLADLKNWLGGAA